MLGFSLKEEAPPSSLETEIKTSFKTHSSATTSTKPYLSTRHKFIPQTSLSPYHMQAPSPRALVVMGPLGKMSQHINNYLVKLWYTLVRKHARCTEGV